MKTFSLCHAFYLLSLVGCISSSKNEESKSTEPLDLCEIHNISMNKGHGSLPETMTVSWTKEVNDAMEKFPHTRKDTSESTIVKYCTSCESELEKVIK
jgi:hypothetical protein